MEVYFRCPECVVGEKFRIGNHNITVPRYGKAKVGCKLPISIMFVADYVWHVKFTGTIHYLKHRGAAELSSEELTFAYLSAKAL